jgi:bifunctional non-homologous end joining protein LigD
MAKSKRRGKIFIDYLRNSRGATVVTPYSPRARAGAPVATPLAWNELTPELQSDSFNVRTIQRRLSRLESDPWGDYDRAAAAMTAILKKKLGLNRTGLSPSKPPT